jgi:hypothetical protein
MLGGNKRFYVLLIILSALAFWATREGKPMKLDHFKVYEVKSMSVDFGVLLKGQFDSSEVKAQLTALTYFANPTIKVHTDAETRIRNRNAHLNWYALTQEQAEPRRTIRFKNQFGQYSVETGDPMYLLVPTEKTSDPGSMFPDSLDHYKCYQVTAIKAMPNLPVITLKDQFGFEDSVQVQKPRYFCVPVRKNRPGAEPGARLFNKKDHLVIYDIPPMPYEKQINTRDQFGKLELQITRSVMLAVPTEKQAVVPHDD